MRRLLLLLAPLVALGAGVLVVAGWNDEPGAGPLEGASFVDGQPLPVRVDYDMGSIGLFLVNRGNQSITIERARLLRVAGPLDFSGVRSRYVISGPAPTGSLWTGGIVGSPDAAEFPTLPLAQNNEVPVPTRISENGNPDEGLQVFFRLLLTEPGIGRAKGVEVTYTAGGRRYREIIDWSFFMCAPQEAYKGYENPDGKECGGVPFGPEDSTLG